MRVSTFRGSFATHLYTAELSELASCGRALFAWVTGSGASADNVFSVDYSGRCGGGSGGGRIVPTFTSVDLCPTSGFYMQETDFIVPLSLLQTDLSGSHRMQSG